MTSSTHRTRRESKSGCRRNHHHRCFRLKGSDATVACTFRPEAFDCSSLSKTNISAFFRVKPQKALGPKVQPYRGVISRPRAHPSYRRCHRAHPRYCLCPYLLPSGRSRHRGRPAFFPSTPTPPPRSCLFSGTLGRLRRRHFAGGSDSRFRTVHLTHDYNSPPSHPFPPPVTPDVQSVMFSLVFCLILRSYNSTAWSVPNNQCAPNDQCLSQQPNRVGPV